MPKKIVKKSRSQKFLDVVFSLIPILGWLPKYKLKDNLVYDAIGGMTVGIMSVPQGMAYATLVGLPPANGLYTSLFPPIIYMIFGTSRHVSLGVFAVVSLLTGSCNIRVTEIIAQERNITVSFDDPQITAISVSIVTSLALLVGIIQITMGLARLDFLTTYLSEQIVQGFMTGAAFHVFTAQINKILGVPLPRRNGFGKFFFMYYDFAMRLINDQQNNYTIIASVVCLILLFSAKQWIGPLCAKCCKIPIPIDLFVVIFGTLISHMLHFSTKFGIKVVGNIPTGIPAPAVPDITLFHYFVSDAFALAIIILVVTISMGKQFALKHSYEIDVRQEFFALGIVETVSSFLPCWPSSTALARTLVYEAAGTKTQLATIFSTSILLLVIYVLGPFVQELPECFLACIVIVALKGMFMQLQQISFLWKRSKLDCAVFMITLVATVVSDILPGLLIGTVAGALLVFYRFQAEKLEVCNGETRRINEPLYIEYDSPIFYMNAGSLKKQVKDAVDEALLNNDQSEIHYVQRNAVVVEKAEELRVLFDMSKVPQIDYESAKSLLQLRSELRRKNVEFKVTKLTDNVRTFLARLPEDEARAIVEDTEPSEDDFKTAREI